MTTDYDSRPSVFEAVGNGSFLYRWDIEEVEREPLDDDGTESGTVTRWRCREVTVWPTVTRAKITETVITALWPAGVEAKLINEYNDAKEGDTAGEAAEAAVARYAAFRSERRAVKARIADDCETLGIR